MAELADAPDLGSGVYDVQVQVLLSAGKKKAKVKKTFVFFFRTHSVLHMYKYNHALFGQLKYTATKSTKCREVLQLS